jgi:hypothetical protein
MLVTAVSVLVVTGLLLDGFIAVADRAFSTRDTSTAEGVEPTTSARRSGGPGSLIAWDTLGRQGRSFVAGGPTADEVATFTGVAAPEPVRVYAGWRPRATWSSGPVARWTTSSGPGGSNAPTCSSRRRRGRAGSSRGRWRASSTSPAATRRSCRCSTPTCPRGCPTWSTNRGRGRRDASCSTRCTSGGSPCGGGPTAPVVFGESLGSFGAEAAFSGEFDLRNRTDGALFVGPPGFNVLHREFTEVPRPGQHPDPTGPPRGRTVRFARRPHTRGFPR